MTGFTRPLLVLATCLFLGHWNTAAALPEDGAQDPRGRSPGARLMERLDTNGDGAIDFEEFRANAEQRMMRRFERLDADQDGYVTPEEFRAARERIRERLRARHERRGEPPLK